MFSNLFPSPKLCCLWDNVEEYCRPRQATDDNIIQRMRIACCVPKATDTLTICDTYCFSTATMVKWMCLNVPLYLTMPVLGWIVVLAVTTCSPVLCSGPLTWFIVPSQHRTNCLLSLPYSGNWFRPVKFSVRAEILCRAMNISTLGITLISDRANNKFTADHHDWYA